jgi:hypothetical protein
MCDDNKLECTGGGSGVCDNPNGTMDVPMSLDCGEQLASGTTCKLNCGSQKFTQASTIIGAKNQSGS